MPRRIRAFARAAVVVLGAAAIGGLAGACSGDADGKPNAKPAGGAARPGGGPVSPAGQPPVPVIRPSAPSYPDTAQGLEALMGALVKAIQDDEASEKARLLVSLQLPDPGGWFQGVFPPAVAERLLREYQPQRTGIGYLASHMKSMIDSGRTAVHAERFDTPSAPGAVGYQSKALGAMVKPVALYSVRLTMPDGKKAWHIWSFVHHEGTFRYVGKMKRADDKVRPVDGRDPLEYRPSDVDEVRASMDGK